MRKLIDKIIELKQHIVSLQPRQQELLPVYSDWLRFGEVIQQLSDALEESGADNSFADHPLSKLNDTVFVAEYPLNVVETLVHNARNLFREINQVIK